MLRVGAVDDAEDGGRAVIFAADEHEQRVAVGDAALQHARHRHVDALAVHHLKYLM